ncbi:MAG: HAD family phosphatase [Ruminococcaceae bacterium]|nr:HAD family phosphatase [Oscillospiraceae bacterium]
MAFSKAGKNRGVQIVLRGFLFCFSKLDILYIKCYNFLKAKGDITVGKFDGVLICTDLDGTLYRNDKTISKENRDAIEYFKQEGGFFTFITGRMPYYSMDAYNNVNPNVPFGCINGGGLYDGEADKYVWNCEMSHDVCDVIEAVDKNVPSAGIQVCLFDKTYFSKESDTTEGFRLVTGIPHLVCPYREVTEPIGKIIFCSGSEDTIFSVEKTLKSHPKAYEFDFIRSERSLFEILPKGVNKGLALEKLVAYLGVDPRKTVAVGDYNNDIGMFKVAAVGVAVANACKDAKDAADFVTVSNEEHAIAQVIADIENKKYGF